MAAPKPQSNQSLKEVFTATAILLTVNNKIKKANNLHHKLLLENLKKSAKKYLEENAKKDQPYPSQASSEATYINSSPGMQQSSSSDKC